MLFVQAEWVLEHFDRAFPLPEEKDMLSRLTGLPRAQVQISLCLKKTHACILQAPRTLPV